jgi:hypothetical protein
MWEEPTKESAIGLAGGKIGKIVRLKGKIRLFHSPKTKCAAPLQMQHIL